MRPRCRAISVRPGTWPSTASTSTLPKADVKSESAAALQEIGKLLQQDPKLKLYIVGHTDNVGEFQMNMDLSRRRADAVLKALTTTYGVAPDRLQAYGNGSLAPVASNRDEAGRAKNRRVELVER
jgi:outer membrane protein OmpA-like peptidoglycan-associated protein